MNGETPTTESREESKFAAVVFHNIQEVYIPGKDIRCCYSIKPSVSPTANDWIGLFKVGWQSCKDYLCYEYSPVIEKNSTSTSSSQNSVLFRGSKLPPEEIEFYQFCYVTSSGEIRGASYPFQIQFSKPGELECNEESDENGDTLLVVRNRTTMLEDSLAKAYDENASLKASKEKAEADCISFQDMILNLESQKNELCTRLLAETKSSEKMEKSWKESSEMFKNSEQALKEARTKILELHKSAEVEKLRSDRTDKDQKKLEDERMQLLQDISDGQSEVDRLNVVVVQKNSEIFSLQEKVEKTVQENIALVKEHEDMLGEISTSQAALKETKQAILALEKSLAEHLEQMNLLQKENSKLKSELVSAQADMDQLASSLNDERDQVNENHLKEINSLEEHTEKLTKVIQDKERALDVCEEKVLEMSCVLEEERAMHKQLIEEYEDSLTNIQGQLNQERAFNNSLSTASDRQVAELQEQLNIQLEKNSTACQQIEVKTQEIKRLEEELKGNEKVIVNMEQCIDETKKELESAKSHEEEYLQSKAAKEKKTEQNSALEGPYFALQTANAQVKNQYLQAKKDMDNLWRQKSDLKRQLTTLQSELPDSDLRFQMANLKKQIEDLRIRLNMGAEAYKAKFKECRKYQNQLKKVQKDSSGRTTPESPLSVTEFEIRNLKQAIENEKTNTAAIKKSLENYKKDLHDAKQELAKVKKENEGLHQKVSKLEEESVVTNEEKQRRLLEDKEVQSHIEFLRQELQSRTEAMKAAELGCKKASDEKESVIATLTEKNQSLQDALESKTDEANQKMLGEINMLRDEVVRHKKIVEDLDSRLQEKKDRETSLLQRINQLEPNDSAPVSAPVWVNDSNDQRNPPVTSSPKPQNVCPVCSIYFPPNCPQKNFEEHVDDHFCN